MNGHELEKLCRDVRRWFIARGAPAGFGDDIQSAAALAIMTAYRKKRLPLEGNRGYYFAVAVRGHGGAGEVVRQLTSPVRLGGRAERRAATRQEAPARMPVDRVADITGADVTDGHAMGMEEWALLRLLLGIASAHARRMGGKHGRWAREMLRRGEARGTTDLAAARKLRERLFADPRAVSAWQMAKAS